MTVVTSVIFLAKAYNTSVLWDEDIDQIPVAATVKGVITESGIDRNFSHEYNFFEFRSRVEDKTRSFLVNYRIHVLDN